MLQSKHPPIGSEVEVHANQSVYRGKLIGVSESEVYLKTITRTWALPFHQIKKINLASGQLKTRS